ncbi:energy transducer TonB [Chloracidobacterium sp. D]|uniref:energy transducer TonB family protein n=1 Tax=Chloracidobacterium sp. D TaxID=2821536 RepID=UPI001B8CC6D7|nr:energy transducer TonB [Chloracidobacterium sp. D]QUV82616.1 energy transducer TonB [Chloracidobacterium sp. D]
MNDERPASPASDEPAPAVPSPKAYILRGFIYATPHTLDFEGEPSWWVRHGFRLGLMLALLLHFSFLGYLAYRTFIAPFEVEVVEREYDVDWITLTDPRYKPLPNPESWVAPPADQPAKPDAQARAAALARRKREEEEARRRAEAERQRREAEREAEARRAAERENREHTADEPAKPGGPPSFGKVDIGPIKAIVTKLYSLSETGQLDIENQNFSITLAFRVEPSGRLSGIRIVKSSGIDEVDEAALNIAQAVSASQALGPLHILTSTALTLDVGPQFTTLRIAGFAASPLEASGLQNLITAGLLLVPRRGDTAAFLNNTKIKAEGKRLTATVQMTRSQVNALLKQNFKRG